MHQDKNIQDKCLEYGIKILPKQIFNVAKIIITNKESSIHDVRNGEKICVLIDDDQLMHLSWKREAEKYKVKLETFFTIDEFISTSDNFAKDTIIYIDSNLAGDLKGEVESEKLAKLGYSELFIATGYSSEDIDKPEWIKEIVGKRAKFNN
jgi:hypothetical protein